MRVARILGVLGARGNHGRPGGRGELAADGDHLHVAWITDEGAIVYLRLR